jgi:acetolactate synthase-1/2/3 large subunit
VKLSDYVMQRVAAEGVRHVFLVPGGAAMHLNDSLGKTPGLEYVANFHEHASAVAAEAYAKYRNDLGVAMVTCGPGSTNALTGVACAWVNSTPVVVLAGQVKRSDLAGGTGLRQNGLQEIDSVALARPITKYAECVTDPASVRLHLDRAFRLSRSGRPGPSWLSFPLDVQAAAISADELARDEPTVSHASSISSDVSAAIDLLNRSERPILLAGGGVGIAGAGDALLELIDELGIPVQTTWVGADLVEEKHPFFAGRPGAFASRGANFAVQNSDFLLAIGARLDFATTGYSRDRFARAAQKVVIDVDPSEVAKMEGRVAVGMVADAGDAIREMLRQRKRVERRTRSEWFSRIRHWMDRYPIVTETLRGRAADTSTYVLVETLASLLGDSDVIVEGSSGVHSEIFFMSFAVKKGQRILADGSFGAMGYGLPAAIGACVASGRRRTILVEGDGGFQPNIQELETVARERLPIKIVIVNNGGYSSIRVSQNRYFGRLVAADGTSGLTIPEIGRIAAAYGIPTRRITGESDVRSVLSEMLESDGPAVVDVVVPADEDRVPRLSNVQKPDGSMVSRPLEDLYPFLDRDEFLSNMMIPAIPED